MRSQEGSPLTGPYISPTPGETQLKLKNQSNLEEIKKILRAQAHFGIWLALKLLRECSYFCNEWALCIPVTGRVSQ